MLNRIKLLFKTEKELYFDLYRILGFYPNNIELYRMALMHKSIMKRNEKGKPINNERLEFLGDAILDAVVGHILYEKYQGKREGFLTSTRSKLVQRETLNKIAKDMGLNKLILCSGRSSLHNSYMGGNAFEALIGAIYLDQGYNACMKFLKKKIFKELVNIDKVAVKEVNFKSKIIEWSQKNKVEVTFELLEQTKDQSGSPTFVYVVVIEGIQGCSGKGFSKKESQQLASKLTLEQLKSKTKFVEAIFLAKSQRTQMEEQPVSAVPIVVPFVENTVQEQPEILDLEEDADFSLDHISMKSLTEEEIIAQAEQAAYAEAAK